MSEHGTDSIIETDRWEKADIFDQNVETLLFHEHGIGGYYGNAVMKGIGEVLDKCEKKQDNSAMDVILDNKNSNFEQLRFELYKRNFIKGQVDQSLVSNYANFKGGANNESNIMLYRKCPDECIFLTILKYINDNHMGNDIYRFFLKLMKTVTRQKPIGKCEWTDNFGLNNLGYAITMPQRKVDGLSEDVYTVNYENTKIIESVKFTSQEMNEILDLIGPLKLLIIYLSDEYKDKRVLDCKNESNEFKMKIIDTAANMFPFYYAGTHGCDGFKGNYKACSYNTIVKYLMRYPMNQICAILNTSKYTEPGQHWTSIIFRNNDYTYSDGNYEYVMHSNPMIKVIFCCSFGNGINSLHQNILDDLHNVDDNLSTNVESNKQVLQQDGYNCGLFAILFVYYLCLYPDQLNKAVESIGVNANNAIDNGINMFRRAIIGSN